MAKVMPFLPAIGGGKTKFQPVFAGDVGEAVVRSLDEAAQGKTYELGGPRIVSLREVMTYICKVTGRRRLLLPLPFPLATLGAFGSEIAAKLALGLLPSEFLLTRDQVKLLRHDNIVSNQAILEDRTLESLGITPCSFETIVPTYLYRFRKTGQFAGP
jgi:NADH dehydrogenase